MVCGCSRLDFGDFYPRSPCGERPVTARIIDPTYDFYPRSPCGERPLVPHQQKCRDRFLSTLSLRRATTQMQAAFKGPEISIHALLAESDHLPRSGTARGTYFYPRSPCGERPCGVCWQIPHLGHFYPRSPCGERPKST